MDGGQIRKHSGGERSKRNRGAGEGRETFAVRADQFPVPSIIDVTSMVACYLSGLTDRNTIPIGSPPTHTHTHTYTGTYRLTHTTSVQFHYTRT